MCLPCYGLRELANELSGYSASICLGVKKTEKKTKGKVLKISRNVYQEKGRVSNYKMEGELKEMRIRRWTRRKESG